MITILQLAEHRGAKRNAEGGLEDSEFHRVGLAIMGGCQCCHASIAAYNAYPSKSGFWKCADCICDDGWETVQQANQDIFEDDSPGSDCSPG